MVKRGLRGRAKGWPRTRVLGKTLGRPTINAVTVAVALGGLRQSTGRALIRRLLHLA
jgi:hypothetical protein